jgi:hypothetical protein
MYKLTKQENVNKNRHVLVNVANTYIFYIVEYLTLETR